MVAVCARQTTSAVVISLSFLKSKSDIIAFTVSQNILNSKNSCRSTSEVNSSTLDLNAMASFSYVFFSTSKGPYFSTSFKYTSSKAMSFLVSSFSVFWCSITSWTMCNSPSKAVLASRAACKSTQALSSFLVVTSTSYCVARICSPNWIVEK